MDVEQFRPIVIFSTVYRCWSSLRARQLIRQFAPHTTDSEYGFLPHKETLQVWLTLQSYLEEAHQQRTPHIGLSTDLKKAFNMIPRTQLSALSHLGVPQHILTPWMAFLNHTLRYFQTGQYLSHATTVRCAVGTFASAMHRPVSSCFGQVVWPCSMSLKRSRSACV